MQDDAAELHIQGTTVRDYTPEFYQSITEPALQSARRIVPLLLQLIGPSSVVDIGCGTGAWLSVFREHGVTDVRGFDAPHFAANELLFPSELFGHLDLAHPFKLERSFDLVLCLEVAEHLPPGAAEGFIASLVQCAPAVLFSAAIPLQGGTRHLNERWPDYWAQLFSQHEFLAMDCVRKRLWWDEEIAPWYAQNCVLYVRRSALPQYPNLAPEKPVQDLRQLNVVHPNCYLASVDLARKNFLELARMLPPALKRAILRRLR